MVYVVIWTTYCRYDDTHNSPESDAFPVVHCRGGDIQRLLAGLIEEKWLADILNLRNCALQVKSL